MKIYIAGPMRGHELFNFPAFFKASLALRELGHDPINPAELDMAQGFDPGNPDMEGQGIDVKDLLAKDFRAILDADAVVFLPGWRKSTGARAERVVAHFSGTKCYSYAEHVEGLLVEQRGFGDPEIVWEPQV